jgi:ribulose-5-phosphate 4-epimerase/fuculose-1-phosphate aldolase
VLSAPELEALVGAHQILHREGHGDGILGHVSLRDPEQAGFWIKRADIGLDEVVGAHSFMLLDLDGVRLYGDGPCHSEWPIHAETMRAHRHINSVVHTHAPSSALLASPKQPLVGFTSEGAYFGSTPVPLFDGGKAHIDEASRARRMAAALNGGLALLIRNHGLLTCGLTVAQATVVAFYLERAASIQIRALSLGVNCCPADPDYVSGRAAMLHDPSFVERTFAYLARAASRDFGGADKK